MPGDIGVHGARCINRARFPAMMIGYARVSSDEQNPNLQRDALTAAGCSVIYEDRITGTTFTRADLTGRLRP
jgi:DNA invertase Pin-like site-specific DNA recombinase